MVLIQLNTTTTQIKGKEGIHMKWRLTPQAQEFLAELEKALELPMEGDFWHAWLKESIKEFRSPDSVIVDFKKEMHKMLEVLGKYAEAKNTKNAMTSTIFFDLYFKLLCLFKMLAFVED